MMATLEQARRDLQEADPDLYSYIAAVEAVKVLDSAKDLAREPTTLNSRLNAMATNFERRVHVLRQKGT
jgi:hypothetical protein